MDSPLAQSIEVNGGSRSLDVLVRAAREILTGNSDHCYLCGEADCTNESHRAFEVYEAEQYRRRSSPNAEVSDSRREKP